MASPRLLLPGVTCKHSPLRHNSSTNHATKCSSPPPPPPPTLATHNKPIPRRHVSTALFLLHLLSSDPNRAYAAGLFDKYVKSNVYLFGKKLDPLEAYVPGVLLSQEQFKDLRKSFDVDQPNFDISRSLLRSGPAASLRINIRAVAQYASDDGKGKSASEAVDECLRALKDLDSLLLRASRKDPVVEVDTIRNKINVSVVALDRLLQTVPAVVLDKGRAIADAYNMPSYTEEESKPEELDEDIKELEAIL